MTGARLFASLACAAACADVSAQVFRSSTAAVGVTVTVLDRRGPVVGLTAEDFAVTDNGVAQSITAASLEALPIDLTLVIDTSGSIRGEARTRLTEDLASLGRLLQPADRLRLLAFAASVRELVPMRAWGLRPSALTMPAGGSTAFIHALVAALAAPSAAGRPHLIVMLSDGFDNASFLDLEDVRETARRSDGALHVVIRRPVNLPDRRLNALHDIAEATGGTLVREDLSRPLPEVVTGAIAGFRSSYQLWFTPQGVASGGWHELRVRVPRYPAVQIRARKGYFAG